MSGVVVAVALSPWVKAFCIAVGSAVAAGFVWLIHAGGGR
jgi:hypothetical protein